MHDVTKRGLALAVATGGLLITGAAPAVSAVSTHPGHPDQAGTRSQPTGDSSHHAAVPVSAPQVKQYSGRHKAAKAAKLTQATRAAKAAEAPVRHAPATHAMAARPVTEHPAAAPHHAAAPHGAAPHHAGPQHAAAPHQTASHHSAPHHTAPHHGAPHHSAPHHTAVPSWHGAPASQPAPGSPVHSWPHDEADGAQAEASDIGGGGLLAGNTVEVPVDAPVNVCGVVATVLGGGDNASDEHCVNDGHMAGGPSSSASADTADNPGALSGNVVQVPVSLPANICGDTVTAVGANDSANDVLCANEGSRNSSTARATAVNSPGLVNGNVVQVPVDAPLNLCGITANVVGVNDTAAGDTCVNGGEHGHRPMWTRPDQMDGRSAGAGAQAVTANSNGAVTGNIVQVPIEAPVNVCGDSVDVVGAFNSALDNHCVNNTAGGSAADAHAVGNNGLATGNVAQLPIDLPTEICGVVAAVGAYHATAEGNSCANTGAATATTSADTSGEAGIITGNVAQGNVNAPVQICGTTVAAGTANSGTEDTDCGNGRVNYPPPPQNCPPPPQNCPPPPPQNCPPPPPENCPPPVVPPPNQPPPPVFPPPPNQPPPPPPHEEITQLPHTGTDVLDFAGIGAGALLLGAGAVYAGRRRSGSAN